MEEQEEEIIEVQFEEVESSQQTSVARSTALMSVATLLSRITGLVRTWAMAFALGNSMITSAYQVANNMPNVVFDLVAGGLLGAAFIPVYLLEKQHNKKDGGNIFACNLLNLTIVVLGALTLASSCFAPQLIATQTFTVGNSDEVVEMSVMFFRIFAFQIVFYGISGVVTGILNANRIYFLPAVAPALNNICVIVSFFVYIPLSAFDQQLAIVVLGAGTTLGVALQALIQLPALKKSDFHYRPLIDLADPALVEALKIALPTMIYIIGTLVAFSFRNAFSLSVGENGPSTLLYAWTWYQLPYGVVSVSLSRALFTELGDAAAKGDWTNLRALVNSGITGNLLLILPLAGLMIILSTPIMELFQAGAFNADDVTQVATVLSSWMVSLPFYAVLMFLYNVFAALRKFMRFAVVSCLLVILQCTLYFFLCTPDAIGLIGVPVADFVYYAGCCIVLLALLVKMIGAFDFKSILVMTLKTLVATAIAMVAAYFINAYLPMRTGMFDAFVRLIIAGGAGLFVSFGLCALMKIPQMSIVSRIVKRLTAKVKH